MTELHEASLVVQKSPQVETTPQKPVFHTLVVFGQGPVKPVLLPSELTSAQKLQWNEFVKDPLHSNEPRFRVIEGESNLRNLEIIQERADLTLEEKRELIDRQRATWQHTGRFALNRWGRQNALAAGTMLLNGSVSEIILSGGKTKPNFETEGFNPLPRSLTDRWPSEAELMKQIITSRFGDEFAKRYPGRSIEDALKLEDASTNTLENFAYTINNRPDLIKRGSSVGLLGTDFHIQRIVTLSHLFSVYEAPNGQLGAQTELIQRAAGRSRYETILQHMKDASTNIDLQERIHQEDWWSKQLDETLAYWLGYFGYVENPRVIQTVMKGLASPQWAEQARIEFRKVGLDFDHLSQEDLISLAQHKPTEYARFRDSLVQHVQNLRQVPPIPPFHTAGNK